MAKDPAFLFYSNDFLTGTMTLTYEERGKYITILSLMHQQGRMKEETICFVVGSFSVNLKNKFSIDEKGFLFNERLEEETEKRSRFTESRRSNGSKGGRKSLDKPLAKPLGKAKHNHMEDVNENEDVIVNTSFNRKPKNLDFKELPEIKIGSAIELLSITKKTKVSKEQITGLWEVFKVQNLTGENYYHSEEKVYSHFINWVKTQNFKDADTKKPLNEQRFDAYVEYANRHS